jgi:outer membrane receptor protein involved in Fe transport
MRQAFLHLSRLSFYVIALVMIFSVAAVAQFRAGIQGTITDSTGATIPGANVTLINQETNQTQTTVASSEGFYRFTGLAPGDYTISVEKENFKKQEIKNIKVDAESVRGIDITLETGGIAETVTVEADTVPLETEDANIRNTITTEEIQRLPQIGRDPYELARLAPGVFGAGARGSNGSSVGLPNTTGPGGSNNSIFQTENQVPISANGQRVSANNFQIDGVSVNSQTWGGAAVITPSQESVKEIQVTSSTYSAEDGRNTGATIKVVTQNGTNQFHGSLFFKYNDPSLNAYNKFPGNPQKVENKYRQYGGSLGGPIFRDKLFFFFTYEGAFSRNNVPVQAWVETEQYRNLVMALRPGSVTAQIFSTPGMTPRIISNLNGTCETANINPEICQNVSGGIDLGSPTGVTGQYIDAFSPSVGGGFDGIPDLMYVNLENPTKFVGNQFNVRIDYNFTQKDSFTVSTYFTPTRSENADAAGRSRQIGDIKSERLNWSAAFIYNRVISARMFNEFRFNINRWGFNEIESNPDANFGVPRIEVEGYPIDRVRFGAPRSEGTPGIFKETQIDIRNIFNWVVGNHNLKIGGEFRKEMNDNSLIGGARPLYSFVGLWNLANDAPIFESINADPTTGAGATGEREYNGNNYALFVQNDWKTRPYLTLNLGLRWEYYSPLTDKTGMQSNLFFGSRGLADSQVRLTEKLFESDWNNFGPQLGFAWSPEFLNGKGVLRGGFGIGYNRLPNSVFLNTRGNPPFFARYGLCCATPDDPYNGGRILYALGSSNSPTSYPANPVLGQGIDPNTGAPIGGSVEIYGSQQYQPTAYVYRYSLEAQYELPYNLVGTLGYQGSAGHHFTRIVNQNFIYAETNPAFFAVYFPTPDVNTNYNGMNARLQRRFANGFQFDAIYRWSKSIDTLSYEGPGFVTNQTFPLDNSTERGPSDFDVRHYAVIYGLWDLPFFRNDNSLAGKILGGWQVNGIWTYHTGFPWTPKIGPSIRTPSGAFFGPIRPVAYFGGQPLPNTNENFLRPEGIFPGGGGAYFQTTLNPGEPDYFNNPPGVGRNVFRGPKYRAFDLSIIKRFRLNGLLGMNEGAGLDLRANFFNLFNQLNLANFGFGDDSTFADRSQFGRATAALAGRTVELQVRFNF